MGYLKKIRITIRNNKIYKPLNDYPYTTFDYSSKKHPFQHQGGGTGKPQWPGQQPNDPKQNSGHNPGQNPNKPQCPGQKEKH